MSALLIQISHVYDNLITALGNLEAVHGQF